MKMLKEPVSNDKFNALIVEYLNTFNYLELNVGLCIRYISEMDLESANTKIGKMSFERKLEYLMSILNKDIGEDLRLWCEEAHSKRHERNMYMHGQWALFPYYDECVEFSIAPWVRERYEKIYPGSRFSIEKLETVVSDIKHCFEEFQKLRRKYSI